MPHIRPNCRTASAFTLLEVILALAILAGAVALLGEVMSIAGRNASDAEAEAHAQLLARSIIDEMLSGMIIPSQQARQPLETDSAIPWVYSVTISDTVVAGLASIEVLVEQDVEEQFHPVKFSLVRWVPADLGAESEDTSEDSSSDSEDRSA